MLPPPVLPLTAAAAGGCIAPIGDDFLRRCITGEKLYVKDKKEWAEFDLQGEGLTD